MSKNKTMAEISFAGQTIYCQHGDNLRQVLLANNLPLYNGIASTIHCRGLGTCGTCAVQIQGNVSEMTNVEKWRLGFPPHHSDSGLRLSCQYKVFRDLQIEKRRGLWRNKT